MSKSKILIIYSSDYPWDIRINKEIDSLADAGYDVSVLSRNCLNKNTFEVKENYKVYRLKNLFKNNLINNILSTPIFFNPIWFYKIVKTIIKVNPNIIIVREIPLAPSVLLVAKLLKIKVILDMAEHFPALIKVNKKYINNIIAKFIICKLNLYEWIEKFSVKNADKTIVVVEEQKLRLMSEYNISENNIILVSNTPTVSNIKNEKKNINAKNINIVYIGNLDGLYRGIEVIVEAAKKTRELPVTFHIVGDGAYYDDIKHSAVSNSLNNIIFYGRLEHQKLLNVMKEQDIGIVPHLKCDVIDYTIPNKLFDYMSKGLPVIVSDSPPLKRIVEECNCGYIFEAGIAESLADIIGVILKNPQEIINKGCNGYNSILNKYNWNNDEQFLLQAISNLLN